MFRIEMLPAGYGDCLWIEYGDENSPHRILIDAGTLPTYAPLRKRIEALPEDRRRFELFIITHIDTDHIDGAVKLLNSPSLGVEYGQVWFNEWKHLSRPEELGAVQGEYAAALIEKQGIELNAAFEGGSVVVPDEGDLPTAELPGGMRLTLLSPGWEQLVALRSAWEQTLEEAGMIPGRAKQAAARLATEKKYADTLGARAIDVDRLAESATKVDDSPANGSSIAVLAEYQGKRCLFAGDAFPTVVQAGIERYLESAGSTRLALDAFKIAHHGSKHNTTLELLETVKCGTYLFSSNGKRYHHPDPEGVARAIRSAGQGARLFFNYTSAENRVWNDRTLMRKFGYEPVFPKAGKSGQTIAL
ncbi:MAG: MBL fold metallo-hydrolase [Acidobacteria bacterium]|nr:MBL fold metallo-hydrolase [Acidobacteriota bacterium]